MTSHTMTTLANTHTHVLAPFAHSNLEPGDGGAATAPAGASNNAAPVDGNAAAATGDDTVSGPSSAVAVISKYLISATANGTCHQIVSNSAIAQLLE